VINYIYEFIKPVFEDLGILDYLMISYSDKADYQINSVFSIAKDMHKNPILIGEEIVNAVNGLDSFSDYFKEFSFVKPGFINIFVSDKLINKCFNEINLSVKKDLKEVFFIDYGGPNIAKPLHIGHLRPAIIGESLKRILNFKGYKTISDVHLGDYGLQIGQVIYGILNEGKSIDDIDIKYLNYIYPKMSALCKEDEVVYNECKKITFDMQQGNKQYVQLFDKIKEVSVNDIKRIYDFLGLSFDMWLGESDSEPFISKLLDLLKSKDLLVLDDGAYVVNVKNESDNKEMPPCIILKNDGSYMYATTDLATIYDRVNKYNPDYILYVTDARQSLHFEQVFRVSSLSGMSSNSKLEHIPFGTINGPDGKPFKTRSGGTLKLDELILLIRENFISKREENRNMSEEDINKIVNAIIKFADLQNNREKSYNFDINKFSDVSGKTGPYVLYSALRVKKILDGNKIFNDSVSDVIYNDIDRELRLKILELDKYIDRAVMDRMPSHVAEYLYDLCNVVNTFYQNINISRLEDIDTKNDYLVVLKKAYDVMKTCLNLLIIDIPSQM
jgi:arginyl-tRNA synthetase